jgi:hypothetical protein
MKKNNLFLVILITLAALSSCRTDDVMPYVTLSSNKASISEDAGEALITASITQPSAVDILLILQLAGNATEADYTITKTEILIPAGSVSASVVLNTVQDATQEGNETIEISIKSITGGISNGSQLVSITIEDDDVPFVINIIMNEVLYDPSNTGLAGDANGDGRYAQNEDEFIEFINLSSKSVNLGGYKIFDSSNLLTGVPNHLIPANTIIPAGGCLVVFGGGTPTGLFGGALVQTSTSGDLNMNNAGDIVTLTDASGSVIATFDVTPLSDNPNESYTRSPDITGDFIQHHLAKDAVFFSPGTKADGTRFLP